MLMMLQCLLVRVTLAADHLTGLCQVTPSTPLSVLEVRVDLLQTFHTGSLSLGPAGLHGDD